MIFILQIMQIKRVKDADEVPMVCEYLCDILFH